MEDLLSVNIPILELAKDWAPWVEGIRIKLQYHNLLRYVIADQEPINEKNNLTVMSIECNNNNIAKCKVILRASSGVKTKYIIDKIKGNDYTVIDPKDVTPRKIWIAL